MEEMAAINCDIVRLLPIGSCYSENIYAPIDHSRGKDWIGNGEIERNGGHLEE
jgi:hypothetical protein